MSIFTSFLVEPFGLPGARLTKCSGAVWAASTLSFTRFLVTFFKVRRLTNNRVLRGLPVDFLVALVFDLLFSCLEVDDSVISLSSSFSSV